MRKFGLPILAILVGVTVGCGQGAALEEPHAPGAGFVVFPGQKGGQDLFGAYEVVPDWPKPLSQLPGHEDWTWGAGQGIFAESPDRVYLFQRGELPDLERPETRRLPEIGPSIVFPVGQVPFRNATTASPGNPNWAGELGVDARWEHCLMVVDREGNIIEEWTQWDSMFRRPHAIYINPFDPEKHVWVVDDWAHAVFKFTNDGQELVQTLGTPYEPGEDETHFSRPTFLAWLSDSTLYVADGYTNTRVVKFDAEGNYLMSWGERGDPPDETRPGHFNSVHGIATDHETRRVFVNDRTNRRVQVFDEDGNFLDQWSYGRPPTSDAHKIYMSGDRHLWVVDRTSSRMVKYDLDGHFLYQWGVYGNWPGGFWGVHGLSVDQEGNVYVAEVNNGGFQKFRPRPGADPAFLIGEPVRGAWR